MASYAPGAGQTCHHSQQQLHPHQYQPRWSLNDLSTELLALIFEQVRDNPHQTSSSGFLVDAFRATVYLLGITLTKVCQLRDIDTQYVSTARLLCQRFNQIAIPIAYKTLVLTERIVAQDAGQHFPQALEHISAHTHHVVARSDLDPAGIKRLLERIRKLSSVR